MSTIINLAFVAAGGAIGSCLRDRLSAIALFSGTSGLGVFTCNVIGCLIIGVLYAIFQRWDIAPEWRAFIFTGLLGGFTTFSSYGLDAMLMLQNGNMAQGLWYIVGTNIAGLSAAAIGLFGTLQVLKYI